jgi:hypothetical protein
MVYSIIQCFALSFNVLRYHSMFYSIIQCFTLSFNVAPHRRPLHAASSHRIAACRSTEPVSGFEEKIDESERRFIQLLTRPAVRMSDTDTADALWGTPLEVIHSRACV